MNYSFNTAELIGLTSENQQLPYSDILKVLDAPTFSKHVAEFYSTNQPTIDSMLGGLSYVHIPETRSSVQFLKDLKSQKLFKYKTVLDIGGGIGRVSSHVLKQMFDNVDMLEQSELFINESKVNFAKNHIRNRFCCSIQNMNTLDLGKYDLIWIQWVVGHISDLEFVELLKNCKQKSEYIVVKDNYSKQGFWFDEKDGNILRGLEIFEDIFKAAGLSIVKQNDPETWPKDLMPIRIWLLK
ncbi:S-adenosylmethionine-dependent_methyltransferase [Hexamita inflata]|uniref:Alpha N-terminal protein methyltransferase 1 n=1 Tax=Hexamita inflata TaxID=28002 RepID=A0AA86VPF4_9EUKA|nr:S-adenosylmethionine-dependent methyltransferase [Hexamita inflata]